MAFTENFTAFFDPSGFAVPVEAGQPEPVYGLLDTRDVVETDAGGYGVTVRRTVLTVPADAIGAPAIDALIAVDGRPYRVRAVDRLEDGLEAFTLARG